MADEEVLIAEAPQNADARNSNILRGVYIHITVADIYRAFLANTQLPHSFQDSVGSWLLMDVLTFSYRHLYRLREEMLCKLLRCGIELIAYYGQFLSSPFQFGKNLRNAVVSRLCSR